MQRDRGMLLSRVGRRELINLLATLLMGMLVIGLGSCTNLGPDILRGDHPIEGEIPSLKEYADEAFEIARSWYADAEMTWAEVVIGETGTLLIYIFRSHTFPNESYLVEYRITPSGFEITTFQSSYEGPPPVDPVISLEESILDSQDLADLALSHGAHEFIARHPGTTRVLIQLCGTSGADAEELGIPAMQPSWRVGISELPLYSMNLLFDPYTGEFLGSIVRE